MRSVILFFIVFLLISCSSNKRTQENIHSEKPVLTSVNYPLYYFAKRIGGELIRFEFPIRADVDPAYWIPDNDALIVYQSADIILANGADYAKWMNNVSLPASRIVNTSLSMEDKYIPLQEVSSHSHGPDGEHEHTGFAFTTWLDFEIAIAQAEAVKTSILSKLPDSKEELEERFVLLKTELMSLQENMKALSKHIGEQNIIGSHPVYQYLSKAYSLNIQSVHFEPNEMPSEDQWQKFDLLLVHHPGNIMLWEAEPLPEVKEILNKKGVQISIFNPCGNKPEHDDFVGIMKKNIQTLKSNL